MVAGGVAFSAMYLSNCPNTANCFSSYGLIDLAAVSLANSLPSNKSRSLHRSCSSTQKSNASRRRFRASSLAAGVANVYSRSVSLFDRSTSSCHSAFSGWNPRPYIALVLPVHGIPEVRHVDIDELIWPGRRQNGKLPSSRP